MRAAARDAPSSSPPAEASYSQLNRYRGGEAQDFGASPEESRVLDATAAKQVFEKMGEGRFAVFVIKGESPSNLRVAEVLKKDEDSVRIWYYVDRTVKNYDNAELTPGLRRLVPEWYDKGTGQVNLRPTSRDLNRGNLVKRMDSFAKGDIEIVLANFAMHSDGKIPDVQVEKIEKWLRRRSVYDERALRALPGKVARRSSASRSGSTSRPGSRAARSRSRSRASEEESLFESAIRLRSATGDLEE